MFKMYLLIVLVALVYNFTVVTLFWKQVKHNPYTTPFFELVACVPISLCWPFMIYWMIRERKWTVYQR